ncbi:MAG: gliding motility-associated C-terminal domain-containing protein [Bacteroidetes bacterium]|nr:gliding motility-associated C-terminal domain-containing protein [Bacteroidota bacterium]
MKKTFLKRFFEVFIKRMIFVRLFALMMLNPFASLATHISGADITYKWVSGNTYQLSLTLYRDCAGIAAPNTAAVTYSSVSCARNLSVNLTRVPGTGQEISHTCSTAVTTCRGGTLSGIQKYEYTGNVTLPANCTDWVFGYAICCRNCAITTLSYTPNNCSGVPGTYVEATLNNLVVPNNSAPTFTNIPVAFFCVGQTFHYNHGAYDVDGDSLVYSFVTPRSAANTYVTFKPGYSASNPLTSSPAITLDNSGDIAITPTALEVGVMTILVKEYRNGVLIGSVLRDMEVYTQSCSNVLPTASGVNGTTNYDIIACPGKPLSFNITTGDGNTSQNVTMTCISPIPGSAFTSTTGQHPVGTYSWTPTVAQARSQPYSFIITVQDDNCPFTGFQTYSYTIRVPPLAATLQTVNATCAVPGNGSATLNVTGSSPYQYLWTPGGNTTASISGLGSGNYSAVVTDRYGCTTTASGNLLAPPPIIASPVVTNVNCFGRNNGSISVTRSGGVAPYSYAWTPSLGNTATINNLSPGNYQCVITDANGCTISTSSTITQPPILNSVISSSTNLLCNSINTGSATVNQTGGTGPFIYNWIPGNLTSQTISNVSAGTYQATVTDSKGCSSSVSITLTQPTPVNVNVSSLATSCGNNNGTSTALASGGTGPYTYLWSPGNQTTATATNLSVGNYSVLVTDAFGCTRTNTVAVTANPLPVATISSTTNVSCFGGSNGSSVVNAANGLSPYTYQWLGTSDVDNNLSNVSAGNYSVVITDARGCTAIANTIISQPALLVVNNSSTSSTCGNANGTIDLSVSGGVSPYNYNWQSFGGVNSSHLGSLPAATYNATITDGNGCTQSVSVPVSNIPGPVAALTSTQNVTCFGNSDGSAIVTQTGGTAPFNYSWSVAGPNAPSISNLSSGIYSVTITDANNCTSTIPFSISQPTALNSSVTFANVNCFNGSTGTASAIVTGGTGPYQYLWSQTGSTSSSITNLQAGTYQATITDANGCTTSSSTSISQPPALSMTTGSTPTTCGNNNGSVQASVSGGVSPYSYRWVPGNYLSFEYTNIGTGTYSVTITDANGCTASMNATVNATPLPTASISSVNNVSCFGGTNGAATALASSGVAPYYYQWSPSGGTSAIANNLSAGTYSVRVTDANGCTTTVPVSISQPSDLAVVPSITMGTCASSNGSASVSVSGGTSPYSYSWSNGVNGTNTISSLSAGVYRVVVNDMNGCTISSSINVENSGGMSATVSALAMPNCFGEANATATVAVSGGTGPFSFAWSPGVSTSSTATGLTNGHYDVTVTDANNCIAITNVVVNQPPQILVSTSATQPAVCYGSNTGQAVVTVNGGIPPYSYQWLGQSDTDDVLQNVSAGIYSAIVTDAHGCTSVADAIVAEPSPIQINSSSTSTTCGNSNGSAAVIVNGGTGPYTYSWSSSVTNHTNTIGNVPAGNYQVIVTDANSCTMTQNINVADISGPVASVNSVQNVNCFGGSNGSAALSLTGGTTPFSYSWTCSTDNSPSVSNLSAGSYSVIVTDGNNCTSLVPFTISQPAELLSSATSTNVNCFSGSTGSASVVANGGTIPYQYLWTHDLSTNSVANNLSAGNYSAVITDGNGCTASSSVSVNQPAAIIVSTTSSPSFCGINNGSIDAGVTGGIAPYNYQWAPGNGNTSSYNSLSAGTYTVTVTDANGCTSTMNSTVIGNPSPVATVASTSDVTCNGGNNGEALINVSSGTGPFNYSWTPNVGSASSLTQLSAGVYSVRIADANGCTSNASLLISEPAPVTVVPTAIDGTCSILNGSASVNVNGGVGPYSYNWSNGISGANQISGLAAGNYSVIISDANGCSQSTSIVIQNSGALNSSVSSIISPNCFGDSNASATISLVGGTAPFNYTWTPNVSSSATAAGLSNGQYSVTITDANQCSSSTSIVINEPSQLILNAASTNVNCYGDNTGQAQVVATGGVTPYTYQWIGSTDTDDILENSYAGNYSVVVTDAHGCTSVVTTTVTEPTQINVSPTATSATCGNLNGSIDVVVNGGVGPYNYSWSIPNRGNVSSVGNIGAGSYHVTVTDANGCSRTSTTGVSNIGGPIVSLGALQNVRCFGNSDGSAAVTLSGGTPPFNYSWTCSTVNSSSVSNIPAGSHTVVISDGNNCFTAIPFNITQPAILLSSATSSNVNCYGENNGSAIVVASGGAGNYSYVWSNGQTGTSATSLSSGNYSVIVTDNNGCTSSSAVVINQPSSISTIASSTDISCHGGDDGTLYVNATGGIAPYSYSWSNGQSDQQITDLIAGDYTLTITDGNGCVNSGTYTINQPGILESAASITAVSCYGGNDGRINLEVNGGVPPYNFQWNPANINTPGIANLTAGNYQITITDVNGCSISSAITIDSPSELIAQPFSQNLLCYNDGSGRALVNVTGGTNPVSYLWSNGSVNSAVTSLQAGNYYVQITDANGCSQTKQIVIAQPDLLVASATTPALICIGQSVSVTASATGGTPSYNYFWSTNATGETIDLSPASTTYYSVYAVDSNGCQSGLVNVQVPVSPPLLASSASSDTICAGEFATVFVNVSGGNGGPYHYQWNNGSNDNYLYVSPGTTQTYTVQITDNCGTPPVTNQVLVYVNPKPNAAFAPFPVEGCPDLSVNFTLPQALVPIVSQSWNFGDGSSSTLGAQTHIYTDPGTYSVTHAVVSDQGCTAVQIAPASVHVFDEPIADFLISTENPTMINPNVSFTDLSIDPVFWSWNFGDGEISMDQNPNHMYSDTGTYIVQLIVHNSKMCYDTIYKPIRIKDEFAIYFPNTFTPNDDGVNEQFKPLAVGVAEFKMLIFDRWGLVIYSTSELEKGWNGNMAGTGKECQMDTYVYMAIATGENGKKKEFIGHVNLVR